MKLIVVAMVGGDMLIGVVVRYRTMGGTLQRILAEHLRTRAIDPHLCHVRLADFRAVIDLDASARDPGVGNEITVIAPARSLDGYSVCELHGIVPIYKFSEDGSEDSHGSQNRHSTRP